MYNVRIFHTEAEMKEVDHPKYGKCIELTHRQDIAFSSIAQNALVNETVLPSGNKTPARDMKIVEKYLVDN